MKRCKATAKSTGERCRRRPHPGAEVCVIHGAGAPQVKRSARQRLTEMVGPALDGLQAALDSGDVRAIIAAARVVLDRSGYGPTSTVQLDVAREELSAAVGQAIRSACITLGIDVSDKAVQRAIANALRAQVGAKLRPPIEREPEVMTL